MSATDATNYCECSYGKLEASIPFSHFRDFEDYLRANVGGSVKSRTDLVNSKYKDIVDLMDQCVLQGPSAPAASVTTTTVATTGSSTTR
jgi:hypothetical protein